MSMTAEEIVDRRRMRRKLSFWRVVSFLTLFVIVAGAIIASAGSEALPLLTKAQIARVTIDGFITEDRDRDELFARLAKVDAVKGVIVAIDSAGGATTGGETLYESIRKLAQKKPTVATVGTVGASAAYMAAIATDRVIARRTSITGSIGVVFQYPVVAGLMDKIGVEVEEVKSAPLKAEPSPFKPTTPAARAVVAALVNDTFNWFVDIVAERRGLERPAARSLADGRVYSGRQALSAGLIDEIGGEDAALTWLESKGVDSDLPVRDWKPSDRDGGVLSYADAVALWLARQMGISPHLIGDQLVDRLVPDSLKLDGLLSVWQASGAGN
jgi:protease-4